MLGRLRKSGHVWRQLAAVILIFALLFQGMTSAVAAGRLAADAAGDTDWAGFALCRHGVNADGGDAALPGGAPDSGDRHCVFCLAGATYVLGAPIHAPEFHTVILAIAPWTFTAWRLPPLTVDASARPRGPPSLA